MLIASGATDRTNQSAQQLQRQSNNYALTNSSKTSSLKQINGGITTVAH